MTDYSEAAENIWAYANGRWFYDGAAGVPYVRADLHEALRDANKALTAGETAYKAMLAQAEDDLIKTNAELAEARAENERLRKSQDEAYRIIGKLETYAIEYTLYDGRPVAAWCADYAARSFLVSSKDASQ